jgi:hypothetical protein
MKNDSTIKAVVAALKWHAKAMEDKEIECIYISHEDIMQPAILGGTEDSGVREFKIRYIYKKDESTVLQELF